MARLQCKSCRGTYDEVLPDGMRYFHVCPPIAVVEVKRSGKVIVVPIDDVDGADIVRVRRDGAELTVKYRDVEPADVPLGASQLPRPDGRDENVIANGPDAGKPKRAAADKSDVAEVERL